MTHRQLQRNSKIRLLTVILFFGFYVVFIYSPQIPTITYSSGVEPTPTPRPQNKPIKQPQKRTQNQPQRVKYSKFSHDIQQHKLACDSCHKYPSANWKQVRKTDEAFPDITDYPKHESCLSCHKQQFFSGRPPVICSICHTNPSPRNSSRHPFANPREVFDTSSKGIKAVSEWQVYFPHDIHIDIISQNLNSGAENNLFVKASFNKGLEGESCGVCHQTYKPQGNDSDEYFTKLPEKLGDAFWLKKGTFKTSPIGHTKCFSCHSPDGGIEPMPTNCATCHKPKEPFIKTDFDEKKAAEMGVTDKIMLLAWRNRDNSATFRHEFAIHNDFPCSTCHNVAEMKTTETKTKKIKTLSCGGDGVSCHITATSVEGGILNYEIDSRKKDANFQCVKCHLAFASSPVPESHQKAILSLAGK